MTNDRLARTVTALEQVPVPVDWSDVERRQTRDSASPSMIDGDPPLHRRDLGRLRVLLAVAAVAVVVVGLTTVWPDPSTDPVRTGPGPVDTSNTAPSPSTTSSPPSTTEGGEKATTTTAPATRTARSAPVVAFTGKEYLVWAGEAGANDVSQRADGFAVAVDTGVVRPIPVAPIDPRSGATGVWTGSELVVCCGTGHKDDSGADTQSAAAWDPATGEWRTLARPPASVARSFPASVWTGELMVVMATGPAVATYDPATDRWTEVTAPPAINRSPEAAWTGDEVVLWDSRYGFGPYPPDGEVADRGWRWAPGREAWEPLPSLPAGSRIRLGSMGWTGTDIVVWGQSTRDEGTGTGALWRPGEGRWRPMSPSPQDRVDAFNGTPGSQTVVSDPDHGRVLVRALQGDLEAGGDKITPLFAYAPDTDRWTTSDLAVPGYHPLVSIAGDKVLVPDQAAPIVGPAPP